MVQPTTFQVNRMIIMVFLTVFGSVSVFSQSDFRDGYIVKNNGDTLRGLVDFRGNKASTQKCTFKEDKNSDRKVFTPEEIQSYRFIDHKYYESRLVESEGVVKKLFLEYLIDGEVDVYFFRDLEGEHYLIDDDSGNLIELVNTVKEMQIDNKRYEQERKEYLGQLKMAFQESPVIFDKVDQVSLTHNSLINIANDYHSQMCPDEACVIYSRKLIKAQSHFGILIGINSFSKSWHRDGMPYYYLQGSEFGTVIFPSIGPYFQTSVPFISERFFVQLESTYSRRSLKTVNSYIFRYNDISSENYLNDIVITQDILGNYLMIKYEYPGAKFKPFVQVGSFVDYYLSTTVDRNLEIFNEEGEVRSTVESGENPFKSYDWGLTLGAGIKRKYKGNKDMF